MSINIDFRHYDTINTQPPSFDGSHTEGVQILATPSVLLASRHGIFHLFVPDKSLLLKRVFLFHANCKNVVDLKWTADEYGQQQQQHDCCFACCTEPGVIQIWKIVPTDVAKKGENDVTNDCGGTVHAMSLSSFSENSATSSSSSSSTVSSNNNTVSQTTTKTTTNHQSPFIIVPVRTIRTGFHQYFTSFAINDRFLAASRGRTLITVYDVSTGRALHQLREPESEYMDGDADDEGEDTVHAIDNHHHHNNNNIININNINNDNGEGGGGIENDGEHENDFTYPFSMYSQGEILVSSSMLGAAICIWDMANGTLLRRHSDIFRRDGYNNWLTSQDELPDGNDVTGLSPILGGNALLVSVYGGWSYLFGFPMNQEQRKQFSDLRRREMDVIRNRT